MNEGLQRILATVGSTVRTENNYYVDGLPEVPPTGISQSPFGRSTSILVLRWIVSPNQKG
jgi:hypothetical protein